MEDLVPEGEALPPPVTSRAHVIGPVCLDLVYSGLSCAPRPGTEVYAAELGISPGGVANIAVALARLGIGVSLSTVFADDPFGQYLWSALDEEGVDLNYSIQATGWNTPVTSSTAVAGEREMVSYAEVPPVAIESLLPEDHHVDAMVVSLSGATTPWLASLHRMAPLVFADVAWDDDSPSGGEFRDRLGMVDVFLPNAAEALACSGCATVEQAAAKLSSYGPLVAVKDGGAGSMVACPGSDATIRIPAVAVDAQDTTGAGDVFDAGFIYASLAGWPLVRRLRFANLCAAQSVRFIGGSLAAPCWRDLAAFCESATGPEFVRDYGFLAPLLVNAPTRRVCRRSCPGMTPLGAVTQAASAR